jgi:hypothetical protein
MVADTLPAHPSLLSFKVVITGITLTSSTGATITLTPPSSPIDLVRLQSDSAFLGTLSNVATGTNSTITVALAAQQITFLNDSGVALTSPSCAVNVVCTFNPTANGSPVITFSQAISGNTGFGIDFDLANSLTLTGTTLTVTLTNSGTTNVLSAFSLPRNSNLAAGQLDLIEDFTGLVTVNGQVATITSNTRGTLSATALSTTNFDPDPSGALCPTGTKTLATCVSNDQTVSMDAVLNSDGTMSIQEIEPLLPLQQTTQQDLVEGTVFSISSPALTQFGIVVTDKIPAATGSLIGGLNVGDLLTVNLSTTPPTNTFLVDTKGLPLASQFSADLMNFKGATDTTAVHLGQTVFVHVTAFTAASGTTFASSTVDTVILRWSRFTATPATQSSPAFTITGLPSYFNAAIGVSLVVQTFPGTPGTDGTTNFEGVTDASQLSASKPVGLRALFLQNSTNSTQHPFFPAKIRQH